MKFDEWFQVGANLQNFVVTTAARFKIPINASLSNRPKVGCDAKILVAVVALIIEADAYPVVCFFVVLVDNKTNVVFFRYQCANALRVGGVVHNVKIERCVICEGMSLTGWRINAPHCVRLRVFPAPESLNG